LSKGTSEVRERKDFLKQGYRNKDKLRALYTRYSIREIGTLYGVSGNAIWNWLKKFGIEATAEDKRALKMIQDLRGMGLSYEDIAQITGIHVSQIYRIKRGDSKYPQSSTVRKLTKLHNRVRRSSKSQGKTEANSIH